MKYWGIIMVFVLCGCKNSENLIGKYENTFESNVIHYVVLKKDHKFLHYYKKGNEDEKINKGVWSLEVTSKKREIKFNTWVDFGYIVGPPCEGCFKFVQIKDGEMIFSYDFPNEMNMLKTE